MGTTMPSMSSPANERLSHVSELEQRFEVLDSSQETLGTFAGVFRPTVLALVGVIICLRQGWVVGNGGVLGASIILVMTFAITGLTALSFSAITTNIRIGAGGVFSLVSQSLGLEAGGAIGIPLYLAQTLGIAFYIYAFRDGWQHMFPDHPSIYIIALVFVAGLGLSLLGERLTLYVHSVMVFVVGVALISMWSGLFMVPSLHTPELWGNFAEADLWRLFAVFFPAGTGIMASAAFAGKLKKPRKSIPWGILLAWGIALIAYIITMVWYSMVASAAELQTNLYSGIDRAAWSQGVVISLIASCFSAILSAFYGAPHVLAALATHRLVPASGFFARISKSGIPHRALILSAFVVAAALPLGNLNRVASLITMFYLITYATINLVVLIEQSLNLISFRPTFRIPLIVPILGTVACVFAMVIINPIFGLIALTIVVSIYAVLVRRKLDTPWETVRSGLVVAVADWVAKVSQRMSGPQYRAWKPDFLIPIAHGEELHDAEPLLQSLVFPRGSMQILTCQSEKREGKKLTHAQRRIWDLQHRKILANYTEIPAANLVEGVRASTAVLRRRFFGPNIIFVHGPQHSEQEIQELLTLARKQDLGFALWMPYGEQGVGARKWVNLWIREQSPDWRLGLKLANLDLAILFAVQLQRNWRAQLRMSMALRDAETVEAGRRYLERLIDGSRLHAQVWLEHASFEVARQRAPKADVHILGLAEQVSVKMLQEVSNSLAASCLFVHDSTQESAMA